MVSQANYKKIQKLPRVNQITIQKGDLSALIRAGDRWSKRSFFCWRTSQFFLIRVYVEPKGGKKRTQDDFRIGLVQEIRSGAPSWLHLRFYKKCDYVLG